MSQSFSTIAGSDTLKASRAVINDNDAALASHFAGTGAPSGAQPGWTWYETDTLKFWGCVTSSPTVTWHLIADFNKTAIFSEDVAAAYATLGHTHAGVYSPVAHNHDGVYSPWAHNHDGVYSPAAHNHNSTYAALTHNHDSQYSLLGHTHSYAPVSHSHIGDAALYSAIIAAAVNAMMPVGFCFIADITGAVFSWTPPAGTSWASYSVTGVTVKDAGGNPIGQTSFRVLRRVG